MIADIYQDYIPFIKGAHEQIYNKKQEKKKEHLKHLYRDDLRNNADKVCEFLSDENITIPRLKDEIEFENHDRVKKAGGEFSFNRPFVAEVQNGRILKKNGMCTDQEYRVILDCARSFKPRKRYKIKSNKELNLLLYRQYGKTGKVDGEYDFDVAFSLTPAGQPGNEFTNYFVWVHGYLTKFDLLEYYYGQTGKKPKIIVPQDPPSWVIESLELLGYEDKIVTWSPDEELLIKKLIVPSNRRQEVRMNKNHIYGRRKVVSKKACKWLRAEATKYSEIERSRFSEKIFISRNDADSRNIENRDQVLAALHDRGFQSYKLAELSFPEQVALFDQAKKIVGAHGAGLTNMIFSTDCKVTEVTGDVFIPTYYIISNLMDLEYQEVSGESINAPNKKTRHQNIKIDPEKLVDRI